MHLSLTLVRPKAEMDKRTRQTQIMGKSLDPRRSSVAGHLVREQAGHGVHLCTCSCVYVCIGAHVHVCICVYRMFLYSERALFYIPPGDSLCGESLGAA